MVRVDNLKVNHCASPVGVTGQILVSWNLVSDEKGVEQAGYKIYISLDKEKSETFFKLEQSGKESAEIPLEIDGLESFTSYDIAVQVITSSGKKTAWRKSQFVTGALCACEWKAKFISAETKADAKKAKGTYVRKTFSLAKQPRKAYVAASALGLYEIYINGERVGKDYFTPGWTTYDKRLQYQMYDITKMVQKGKNACGMSIGTGWFKGELGRFGKRNLWGDNTAAFAQMVFEYEDGTRETVCTDETWKCEYSPVLFTEIYHGETYDAQLYNPAWCTVDFNDGNWRKPEIACYDVGKLVSQPGCRVRAQERLPAKRIFTTPEGDTVVDFGQNLAGWVEFTVDAPAGTKIQYMCFEVLDSAGNVYLENLGPAKQTVTYTCAGNGKETFHPIFSPQGFQFIKILKWYGKPQLKQFTAIAVHSDMEPTGTFECSNELVNGLQHNILWGMKSNFLEVPTDCPQRNERLGWTGDAQIFGSTASYLMDTSVFFMKWLKDLALDQYADGEIPHVSPDIFTGKVNGKLRQRGCAGATAWADAIVINTWVVYLAFGSKQVVRDQYTAMKKFVDWMWTVTDTKTWPLDHQFGDWVALDAKPGSYDGATPLQLLCYAYEYYSTMLFAKMAMAIGENVDVARYLEIAEKVKEIYQKKYFSADGVLKIKTQTAYIVSLYFGLVPENLIKKTSDGLIALIKKYKGNMVTGFIGTPYICHALSENDHLKDAYKLLLKEDLPSWLYQVKRGATTIWEHLDGLKEDGSMWSPRMNSFNHYAYGSVGDWLYKVCAGIRPDECEPGYKHFFINPHIGGGFSYVDASYKSIYGKIACRWENEGESVKLRFTVPANTSATVILAGAARVISAGGLSFSDESGECTAIAKSGDYTVTYKLR